MQTLRVEMQTNFDRVANFRSKTTRVPKMSVL
jgi:hypothetical protein